MTGQTNVCPDGRGGVTAVPAISPTSPRVHHTHTEGRKRHYYWLKANEVARKSALSWQIIFHDRLQEVENYARLYARAVHDKKVVLERSDGRKILVIDYITRFSEKYAERTRVKLSKIAKLFDEVRKVKGVYANFITLTIDPSKFYSLMDAHKSLSREFNKFHTALKKKLERKGHAVLFHLKHVEIGKKNNLAHIHVIYITTMKYIPAEWLHEIWKAGRQIKAIYFDNVGRGINYVSKYLRKNLMGVYEGKASYGENKERTDFLRADKADNVQGKNRKEGTSSQEGTAFRLMAYLWAVNGRVFSMSSIRRLIFASVMLDELRIIQTFDDILNDIIHLKNSKKRTYTWIYVGSFPPDVVPLNAGVYNYDIVLKECRLSL